MGKFATKRIRYVGAALVAVLGWAGAPPLASAVGAEVTELVFNNISGSTALNGLPDSSSDVDDVTVAPGQPLYLPASANPAGLSGWLRRDDGSAQPFTPAQYTVTRLANGEYTLTFRDGAATVTAHQSSKVPAMYIKTKNPGGLPWIEKAKTNVDAGGSMALVSADASVVPRYNGPLGQMKGRGNATWTYEKKPYQIKVGTSTELVPGAGSSKTWVLLANYLDASLIRNELSYNLEGAVLKRAGLTDSSIKGQMIDLWVDGGFRGSYYLTEKVEVGPTRIAITDLDKANEAANPGLDLKAIPPTPASSSDPRFAGLMEAQYVMYPNAAPNFSNGGYLFEMDFAGRSRAEASYFITKRGTPFTLKSPELAHPDELAYAARYIQNVEDAIFSDGDSYQKYIDVQSFANYYVLEELIANWDGFKSSTYMYMDGGGKLVASPVWDSDLTLGSRTSAPQPTSMYVGKLSRLKPQWTKQLLAHADFREAVQKAYRENFTPELNALISNGGLQMLTNEVADSARLNKLRWPTHPAAVVWNDKPSDDVAYLRTYLSQRHAGMTALFGAAFLKNARLADGIYTIANGKLNLDVAGSSTASQANVQLSSGSTTASQRFSVKRGADSYYTITNVNSGKVLEVAEGTFASGTNVWQNTPNGTPAQKWTIGTYDGANFTISSALGTTIPADTTGSDEGYSLDAQGGGTTPGTNIRVYRDNGSAAQKFVFTPALAAVSPSSPPAPSATAGDARATVSWTAPASDGGAPVTRYTVTAKPGGRSVSVAAPTTTAVLSGLTNGTAYTFTVTATNSAGTSAPSTASGSVTPKAGIVAPSAPSAPTATAGDAKATVSWTAPASNGGSAVTRYTVTAKPGGRSVSMAAPTTTGVVGGLMNGTAYTFTVTATNGAGTSPPSKPSTAVTPRAPAPAGAVTREAGSDRYATSAAISRQSSSPGVRVAYVATGSDFPDALSGAAAAGKAGGPVLLVQPNTVPNVVAAELSRLRPGKIVILGGTGAVSSSVQAQLGKFTKGTVSRQAGSDRYGTSAAISRQSFAGGVPVAYIATGGSFPDALSGAAAAGKTGGPVLLVQPHTIPAVVASELSRLRPAKIVVLGGTAGVSGSVQSELGKYTKGTVTRQAGSDRYGTSAAISHQSFAAGVPVAYIATGRDFPDALSGAAAAGKAGGPVLLVQPSAIPKVVATELSRLRPANIVILGGTGAVGQEVHTALGRYLR